MRKKKRITFLVRMMLIATVPAIMMSLIINVISNMRLKNQEIRNLETRFSNVTAMLQMELSETDKEKMQYLLENVKEKTGLDCAIYCNSDVEASTFSESEAIRNVLSSSKSMHQTLDSGMCSFEKETLVGKEKWNLYAFPIFQENQTIVGIGLLAEQASVITDTVHLFLIQVAVITLILLIFSFFVSFRTGGRIVKHVKVLEAQLDRMSHGDLSVELAPKATKRGDELGDMARELEVLQKQWHNTIAGIMEKCKELANASSELSKDSRDNSRITEDFSKAIDDIAKGSMSHAEETQTASVQMQNAGKLIEDATKVLNELIENARKMRISGEQATVTISELASSNDIMIHAIKKIEHQTNITNQAANQISDAVSIIDSIASQTSLLALNASIEAARAGEEGKGFAVVASEIQKLAEQTNNSVKKIDDTIQELLNDSKEMVAVMQEVNVSVFSQAEKFQLTKKEFDEVSSGITASVQGVRNLRESFATLQDAKDKVLDGLSVLSHLAQESAATTQEATASCEELAEKTMEIAKSSEGLDDISKVLYEAVEQFKIE